jgi:hypothetical protein
MLLHRIETALAPKWNKLRRPFVKLWRPFVKLRRPFVNLRQSATC